MKPLEKLNTDWLLATEIHKLEARLWRKAELEKVQTILITSANRGEGKSTTVALLATALALHPDRRILAVDLDFREPRLSVHFSRVAVHGLGAVLLGECSPESALIKTDLPNLDLILPAEQGEDPGLLLRSRELAATLEFYRKGYDLILMDAPALGPVADTSAVLPFVDGVVLMTMAGKTTKPQLKRAREICLGMEANILGLIVGNMQESESEYADAEYYANYRRTKPGRYDGNKSQP